jgi:dUTP pyrophosphatase
MNRGEFFLIFEVGSRGGQMPTRGSKQAAGLDLYSAEDLTIWGGEGVTVDLDIRSEFPPGWVGLIWDRSSMGVRDIHRYAGVIDSDYRGTWKVRLKNTSGHKHYIHRGDRIAQVIFQPIWLGKPTAGIVTQTERAEGGFGSTGT